MSPSSNKRENVSCPSVPDVLGGVDDLFDARHAQGDVHGGHAGKVEGFQRHLSARLADALGAKSPDRRARLHLSSAGQTHGNETTFPAEGNDSALGLMASRRLKPSAACKDERRHCDVSSKPQRRQTVCFKVADTLSPCLLSKAEDSLRGSVDGTRGEQ